MGISSVVEDLDGRSSRIDKMYQSTYVRRFIVETDRPETGSLQVRSATGIPQPGATYNNGLDVGDPDREYDNGAFVQEVDATQDSSGAGIQWLVTVNYGPYDTSTFGSNPTLWPVRVSFGGEERERVLYFDRDGNPVRNSAGDPFDPPITVDDGITTMMITRNELVSAYSPTLADYYRHTINDATWNGFDAGTVKMGVISTSEPQYDSANQAWYLQVNYPIKINRYGWTKKVLDAGCNELTDAAYYGAAVKTRPIMNEGQQVSDPVPLDGSGYRLDVEGTPVTLEFDGYDAVDWSGLSIDLSLRLGA